MSWHIGDYKKDTGHLRAAGHGAYFLLCMHYWSTGGLPDDDKQLAAIACMSDREWKAHRPVIQKFFKDGWRHKRIDEELTDANAKYLKRATAGHAGGIARAKSKQNGSNASSNAAAKLKQPITDNPNQEKEKEDTADAVSPSASVFESGIIRLNKKHFDEWTKAYSFLDLRAELLSLTEWAQTQKDRWFFAVSGALAKRNREQKNAAERPNLGTLRERGDAW